MDIIFNNRVLCNRNWLTVRLGCEAEVPSEKSLERSETSYYMEIRRTPACPPLLLVFPPSKLPPPQTLSLSKNYMRKKTNGWKWNIIRLVLNLANRIWQSIIICKLKLVQKSRNMVGTGWVFWRHGCLKTTSTRKWAYMHLLTSSAGSTWLKLLTTCFFFPCSVPLIRRMESRVMIPLPFGPLQ